MNFRHVVSLGCLGIVWATAAAADLVTWNGGDGTWQTASMWSTGSVPTSGQDVLIEGGAVAYVPGGDLNRAAGTTLTLGAGGTFVQTTGGAWMQIHGDIVVDGGEFDTGTAGRLQLHGAARLIVKSGTARVSCPVAQTGILRAEGGELHLLGTVDPGVVLQCLGGTLHRSTTFVARSSYLFGGGNIHLTGGEFQYSTPIAVSGGTIRVPLLAAQNAASVLTLSGGHIIATGAGNSGFWQAGSHIDFTETSTGMLTFTNSTPAAAYGTYFAGATPRVRLAGATLSQVEVATFFDVVESAVPGMGNSVDIAIKQAAAGVASFVGDACAADDLASTSVRITASIDDPGSPAAEVFACYGTVNALLNFEAWQTRELLGTAQGVASFTSTPALAPDSVYFYRMAATNESGVVFATPSPAFVMTAPVGVSAPAALPENSQAPAPIVISRPAANNCSAVALSVPFLLGGTAVPGTHYTLSAASPATIPAGADSVVVALTPIADWGGSEERTVVVTLGTSPSYLAPTNGQATLTLLDAVLPAYPTNAFMGAVSESSADPANWSLGVVPAPEHVILFSPEYAQRQLDWVAGSTDTVAEWRQPLPFPQADFRVLFHTTPESPLTVAGDCLLEGGYWIHEGPSATPAAAVAVDILGNLTVGAGAQINAGNGVLNQANGARRGYYLAGPGYQPSAGAEGTGSSYGGEGATNDVTYGSILNPLSYGSSGRGDNANFAGGGLIVLNVAGTTTLDGSILSQGFGYIGTGRGASTGGTVNLTTGSLQGGGILGADGGTDLGYGSGSGGRIRVKLTDPSASFGAFSGTMTARGKAGYPGSAAGTITLQSPQDTVATAVVLVDNALFSDATNAPYRAMCTHLPPKVQTDASLAGTTWVLRNHASLRLTRNVAVEALRVEGTTARIFTESYAVSVKEFTVDGTSLSAGSYSSADYPGLLHGDGAVVVLAQGTVILVR